MDQRPEARSLGRPAAPGSATIRIPERLGDRHVDPLLGGVRRRGRRRLDAHAGPLGRADDRRPFVAPPFVLLLQLLGREHVAVLHDQVVAAQAER